MVPVEILLNFGNYFRTLQLGFWKFLSGIVFLHYYVCTIGLFFSQAHSIWPKPRAFNPDRKSMGTPTFYCDKVYLRICKFLGLNRNDNFYLEKIFSYIFLFRFNVYWTKSYVIEFVQQQSIKTRKQRVFNKKYTFTICVRRVWIVFNRIFLIWKTDF